MLLLSLKPPLCQWMLPKTLGGADLQMLLIFQFIIYHSLSPYLDCHTCHTLFTAFGPQETEANNYLTHFSIYHSYTSIQLRRMKQPKKTDSFNLGIIPMYSNNFLFISSFYPLVLLMAFRLPFQSSEIPTAT